MTNILNHAVGKEESVAKTIYYAALRYYEEIISQNVIRYEAKQLSWCGKKCI